MCIRGYRLKGCVLNISKLRNEVTGFTGKAAFPAGVGEEEIPGDRTWTSNGSATRLHAPLRLEGSSKRQQLS